MTKQPPQQDLDAGDGSSNFLAGGNITGNTFNFTTGIDEAKAREIAKAVSHDTVLLEARAVAEELINERVDYIDGLIFDRIRRYGEELFNRFGDPRFLAALTAARVGYGETGDTELADLLAGLVVGLAAQPIRSRREIFQRQAIDVAAQLTTEHVNALAASILVSRFKVGFVEGTDALIEALDKTLSPYYGRIPTSRLDCQYMCSMGVCEDAQLGSFAIKVFQRLYEVYRNLMYPALTYADLEGTLLQADDPENAECQRLLVPFVESDDDLEDNGEGATVVPKEKLRFRLADENVERILSSRAGAEKSLSENEIHLRTIILERSLQLEQFKEQLHSTTPELANFLEGLDTIGILEFPLQPVGLMLARYKVADHAPVVATLIDHMIDKG